MLRTVSRPTLRLPVLTSRFNTLSLPPPQLTEILQLMNAYFSAIHRQRGKVDDGESAIMGGTEVGFRRMASTLAPPLLELPSHTV